MEYIRVSHFWTVLNVFYNLTFLSHPLSIIECRVRYLLPTRHRFSSARNAAYQGGPFFCLYGLRYTKQFFD